MNTVVNRILPDGTYDGGWLQYWNNYDDEYNMLSLYMQLSGQSTSLLFPERREKLKDKIKHGKLGTIFFEYEGIVYTTVSSVESLNRRKRYIQKLQEKRCRTKAKKSL